LISSMATFLFFRFARPAGSGPAGPVVGHDAFSAVWSHRPVLLVGLGDSVTAGFGARKGYSYFDRLARNPADEYPQMNGICLSAVFSSFQTGCLNRQKPFCRGRSNGAQHARG